MATESYSVIAQVCPSGTTETTLYTVPGATSVVISTLAICNAGATGAVADVNVKPAGAVLANQHQLIHNITVDPYSTTFITAGITLATTDVISVRTDTINAVAFQIFGTVIA